MQNYYNLSLIRNVHPSQLNGSYSLTVHTEHNTAKVHLMNKVVLSFQDSDGQWKQIDSKLYHWDWMKYGAVPNENASYRLVLNTRLHKSEHADLTGFEHLRLRKPINVGVYQEYGWVKPVESYDYSTYVMDAAETLNPIWLEYKTNTAAKYQPVPPIQLIDAKEDPIYINKEAEGELNVNNKNMNYVLDKAAVEGKDSTDIATVTIKLPKNKIAELIDLVQNSSFQKDFDLSYKWIS